MQKIPVSSFVVLAYSVAVMTLNAAQFHISDAYIPYDPPHGVFGYFRWLEGEKYDYRFLAGRHIYGAKIYGTDLLGMRGIMINITDPDADIMVYKWPVRGPLIRVNMKVMEAASDHKVVYVNNGRSGEAYHRLLIVVVSPHPERRFNFYLSGYPDD